MNNKHIFSKEYTEKKNRIIDSIEKTEQTPVAKKHFPTKALVAAAVVCVILTTSVIAAGVIGRQFKLNMDYIPEGVDEVVGAEERMSIDGFPSLEYYIVDMAGEDFTPVDELPPEQREGIEYEVFSVNGHYARIIHYVCWDPEEDFEEFTDKQLFVQFEEEELAVQIWATNLISIDELKKVAEGLSLEPTEDGSVAVKIHKCD